MVDYLKAQKIIHWLMAFVIMLDLNVAQKFGGDMELWDRLESRADHATCWLNSYLFIFFKIVF
jgi:cytochrome b561